MRHLIGEKMYFKTSVIFSFILLTLACKKNENGINGNNTNGNVVNNYPREVTVEYRVTKVSGISTELAYGSYRNASGGTDYFDRTTLPFTVSFKKTAERGESIALAFTEYNNGQNSSSTLKAEILIDNEVKESKTFTGTPPILGSIAYVFQ